MRVTFFKGIALGAVTSMLTFGATAALAGTGVGAPFNLGKTNKVNATSTLIGSSTGSMLHVINTAGQGGVFSSAAGPAASFTVASGQPPFTVNSSVEVPNLTAQLAVNAVNATNATNAGLADSAKFATTAGSATTASTANNASNLGGVPASGYQQSCSHGSILAFAQVPASPSFPSAYTALSGGSSCGAGNFAKRVAQDDYRALVCGTNGANNPVALVTDTSFSDFAGIQLVSPDSDAISTCSTAGTSQVSEFKVTTGDTSGVGLDEPFNFAQLGN